jgi:hypothetical protein
VIGAPSASLGRPHRHEPLARYNLFRIDTAARAIELVGRGLEEPEGGIVEIERRSLSCEAAVHGGVEQDTQTVHN